MGKKQIHFAVGRAVSVTASATGFLVMIAADCVVDNKLAIIQLLSGLMIVLTGLGYYNALKYMELYQREREKRRQEACRGKCHAG